MADESRYRRVATLRVNTDYARRPRPVKQSVRAIWGAGQLRRRAVERPRRLRVGRRHAQGLGRVERTVPAYAERAHGLGAAPAPSQTVRRLLADTATGAGQLRRRPPERPRRVRIGRQHAQDVESVERRVSRDATRAHSLCAAPASSQTVRRLLADTSTGAGLVRRRPPGRPRRVRVARRQTQGVGRVERSVPSDSDPALSLQRGLGTAPASS